MLSFTSHCSLLLCFSFIHLFVFFYFWDYNYIPFLLSFILPTFQYTPPCSFSNLWLLFFTNFCQMHIRISIYIHKYSMFSLIMLFACMFLWPIIWYWIQVGVPFPREHYFSSSEQFLVPVVLWVVLKPWSLMVFPLFTLACLLLFSRSC